MANTLRGGESLPIVFNCITSGQVPPLLNVYVSHRSMRIQTGSSSKSVIIPAMCIGKATWVDGLLGQLFLAVVAVFVERLLSLIRIPWKSEIFPREWKKRMFVKIPKKGSRLKYIKRLTDEWRSTVDLGIVLLSMRITKLRSKRDLADYRNVEAK